MLGAGSVIAKVAVRDWHAVQFDTARNLPARENLHDTDGMVVLAPSKHAFNLGGTRVTLLRKSS
jgi:hypothetical protein